MSQWTSELSSRFRRTIDMSRSTTRAVYRMLCIVEWAGNNLEDMRATIRNGFLAAVILCSLTGLSASHCYSDYCQKSVSVTSFRSPVQVPGFLEVSPQSCIQDASSITCFFSHVDSQMNLFINNYILYNSIYI